MSLCAREATCLCIVAQLCRKWWKWYSTDYSMCAYLDVWMSRSMFELSDHFWFLVYPGSTLSKLTYSPRDFLCVGEYTIDTYTIGACSSGGVMYQIVPGTASLVPSLAPTVFSLALTLQLSGYFVRAQYSDDRCTTITSAVSHPLNVCSYHPEGVGDFVKYTATAYAIATTMYSDSLCMTAVSTFGPTYTDYTGTCVGDSETSKSSSISSVNSNGVPPSSLPMASNRLVPIISLTCVMASQPTISIYSQCL